MSYTNRTFYFNKKFSSIKPGDFRHKSLIMKWRVCHTDTIKIQLLLRLFSFSYSVQLSLQQECIPAGCVPPAHWPWGSIPTRGGLPARGVPAQGVYLPGGVPARGCTCQGNIPAGTPLPCGQNSWHTLLKILPCPNFVASGKNVLITELTVSGTQCTKHSCVQQLC